MLAHDTIRSDSGRGVRNARGLRRRLPTSCFSPAISAVAPARRMIFLNWGGRRELDARAAVAVVVGDVRGFFLDLEHQVEEGEGAVVGFAHIGDVHGRDGHDATLLTTFPFFFNVVSSPRRISSHPTPSMDHFTAARAATGTGRTSRRFATRTRVRTRRRRDKPHRRVCFFPASGDEKRAFSRASKTRRRATRTCARWVRRRTGRRGRGARAFERVRATMRGSKWPRRRRARRVIRTRKVHHR